MEYQCVHIPSGKRIFHFGPVQGTNNIGEFLAIVHALALMRKRGLNLPIFTDSKTALTWLRTGKAKTTLNPTPKTAQALQLTQRAELWLKNNANVRMGMEKTCLTVLPIGASGVAEGVRVEKWNTEEWGEIPADFGRK